MAFTPGARGQQWPAARVAFGLAVMLTSVSLAVALSGDASGRLRCELSGMCSLGKTKVYHGPVHTTTGFKNALEAVSFKREIILVTFQGMHYMEHLYQLHSQFVKLGMAHFLTLSTLNGCREVSMVGRQAVNISCAWDESPMHARGWLGSTLLWHLRWRFLARAARIGYNILSLDSDYLVLNDPYIFLKTAPLNGSQLLGAAEGGYGCAMNGGFAYMQNVQPDGPVAWLFHHATELPLRWFDDDFALLQSWGKMKSYDPNMCMTLDQLFLEDALHSTISGRTITKSIINTCKPDDWKSEDGLSKFDAMLKQVEMISCHTTAHLAVLGLPSPPFPNQPELDGLTISFNTWTIRVPNHNGTADSPMFASPTYTTQGGKYSDSYFTQLKEDCESCPWWKDEKPEDAAAAAAKKETFGFAPKWLTASASRLNNGFLDPVDGSPPRQVLVHSHVMTLVERLWKTAVSKIYRAHDWDLSRFLHDGRGAQLSGPGPYFTGAAPQRVIALSPFINLSATRSAAELKRITAGLVQLAILSNRSIVYPDAPCHAPWAHQEGASMQACDSTSQLLQLQSDLLPYAAKVLPSEGGVLKREYRLCTAYLADVGCLGPGDHISGMLNVEFEQWLEHDMPGGPGKGPELGNTVLYKPRQASAGFGGVPVTESVIMVGDDEAVAELAKLADQPLIYLGHPVVVEMQEREALAASSNYGNWKQRFNQVLKHCRALHHEPTMQDHLGAANVSSYITGPKGSLQQQRGALGVDNGTAQAFRQYVGPALGALVVILGLAGLLCFAAK